MQFDISDQLLAILSSWDDSKSSWRRNWAQETKRMSKSPSGWPFDDTWSSLGESHTYLWSQHTLSKVQRLLLPGTYQTGVIEVSYRYTSWLLTTWLGLSLSCFALSLLRSELARFDYTGDKDAKFAWRSADILGFQHSTRVSVYQNKDPLETYDAVSS